MQGYPPRLLALSEQCPAAMQQRDYWNISDFMLVREVGNGAASTVYYGVCRKSCLPVAIKVYNKQKLTRLNRRQVEREINIHASLSHPHIIDFYAGFEDDTRIYLVMEYAAGGDLFDEVKRRGGRLPETEVVQAVMYPYLCALSYLHARGVLHRDIKPENTVFTRERIMKVTDFGLAVDGNEERPVTRLGTLDYMAPEVLCCPDKHLPNDNKERADLAYGPAIDAWAMGVLAYELIVGRPPFGMSCREATMRAITSTHPALPEWLSPGAADFIMSALHKEAHQRATVQQLLQHPWVAAHAQQHASMGLYKQPTLACSGDLSAVFKGGAIAAAAGGAGGAAAARPLSARPEPAHAMARPATARGLAQSHSFTAQQAVQLPGAAGAAAAAMAVPGSAALPTSTGGYGALGGGGVSHLSAPAGPSTAATAVTLSSALSSCTVYDTHASAIGAGASPMDGQQQQHKAAAYAAQQQQQQPGLAPLRPSPQYLQVAQTALFGSSPPLERPAKRAMQRCLSGFVDAQGILGAMPSSNSVDNMPIPQLLLMGQPAQQVHGLAHQSTSGGHAHGHGHHPKGHDATYWCTDGKGWGANDPLAYAFGSQYSSGQVGATAGAGATGHPLLAGLMAMEGGFAPERPSTPALLAALVGEAGPRTGYSCSISGAVGCMGSPAGVAPGAALGHGLQSTGPTGMALDGRVSPLPGAGYAATAQHTQHGSAMAGAHPAGLLGRSSLTRTLSRSFTSKRRTRELSIEEVLGGMSAGGVAGGSQGPTSGPGMGMGMGMGSSMNGSLGAGSSIFAATSNSGLAGVPSRGTSMPGVPLPTGAMSSGGLGAGQGGSASNSASQLVVGGVRPNSNGSCSLGGGGHGGSVGGGGSVLDGVPQQHAYPHASSMSHALMLHAAFLDSPAAGGAGGVSNAATGSPQFALMDTSSPAFGGGQQHPQLHTPPGAAVHPQAPHGQLLGSGSAGGAAAAASHTPSRLGSKPSKRQYEELRLQVPGGSSTNGTNTPMGGSGFLSTSGMDMAQAFAEYEHRSQRPSPAGNNAAMIAAVATAVLGVGHSTNPPTSSESAGAVTPTQMLPLMSHSPRPLSDEAVQELRMGEGSSAAAATAAAVEQLLMYSAGQGGPTLQQQLMQQQQQRLAAAVAAAAGGGSQSGMMRSHPHIASSPLNSPQLSRQNSAFTQQIQQQLPLQAPRAASATIPIVGLLHSGVGGVGPSDVSMAEVAMTPGYGSTAHGTHVHGQQPRSTARAFHRANSAITSSPRGAAGLGGQPHPNSPLGAHPGSGGGRGSGGVMRTSLGGSVPGAAGTPPPLPPGLQSPCPSVGGASAGGASDLLDSAPWASEFLDAFVALGGGAGGLSGGGAGNSGQQQEAAAAAVGGGGGGGGLNPRHAAMRAAATSTLGSRIKSKLSGPAGSFPTLNSVGVAGSAVGQGGRSQAQSSSSVCGAGGMALDGGGAGVLVVSAPATVEEMAGFGLGSSGSCQMGDRGSAPSMLTAAQVVALQQQLSGVGSGQGCHPMVFSAAPPRAQSMRLSPSQMQGVLAGTGSLQPPPQQQQGADAGQQLLRPAVSFGGVPQSGATAAGLQRLQQALAATGGVQQQQQQKGSSPLARQPSLPTSLTAFGGTVFEAYGAGHSRGMDPSPTPAPARLYQHSMGGTPLSGPLSSGLPLTNPQPSNPSPLGLRCSVSSSTGQGYASGGLVIMGPGGPGGSTTTSGGMPTAPAALGQSPASVDRGAVLADGSGTAPELDMTSLLEVGMA